MRKNVKKLSLNKETLVRIAGGFTGPTTTNFSVGFETACACNSFNTCQNNCASVAPRC